MSVPVPSLLVSYQPNLRVVHWIHSYAAQVGLEQTRIEAEKLLEENLITPAVQ